MAGSLLLAIVVCECCKHVLISSKQYTYSLSGLQIPFTGSLLLAKGPYNNFLSSSKLLSYVYLNLKSKLGSYHHVGAAMST